MPDLQVIALITAQPGAEQEVAGALSTLVTTTREEDGCLFYELLESTAAPGTFVTVERWRDQAALDAHMAGPSVASAMSTARKHLAGAPVVHPLRPVS